MSNIFLSTSLIFLASEEAGCLNDKGEVAEECDTRVHGFKPATLIANIAVISGVLAALLMPMCGAIVDCTPYRKHVGVISVALILAIQLVQAFTISETWFPMAILQAIAGFLYQIQVLTTYAYLPEIARSVGEKRMTRHTATFVMVQFAAQASFLVVVIAVSIALDANDVQTAHFSQGLNVVWSGTAVFFGWRLVPAAPKNRDLPEGHSLWTEGFIQTYTTAKHIWRHYGKGLRWYFLALIFAEAAANAFTIVAVIYLDEHLGMSTQEIGLFFLVTLLATIPGSKLGAIVTAKLNPNKSWQVCMAGLAIFAAGGSYILDIAPSAASFGWALCIGIFLGWFYPVENLFFSMILPKSQEAEMAGFFVYCTQILGWLPPLLFAALVEADVKQTYGVMAVNVFFLVAIGILRLAAPWEEILDESGSAPAKD